MNVMPTTALSCGETHALLWPIIYFIPFFSVKCYRMFYVPCEIKQTFLPRYTVQEGRIDRHVPGLHSCATRLRTSTAAGHCWINSSQNELSSSS